MKQLSYDDEIDHHLQQIMYNLNAIGIKHVSKPMALRVIIQMNKEAQIKLKKKNRSKNGIVFL